MSKRTDVGASTLVRMADRSTANERAEVASLVLVKINVQRMSMPNGPLTSPDKEGERPSTRMSPFPPAIYRLPALLSSNIALYTCPGPARNAWIFVGNGGTQEPEASKRRSLQGLGN